MSIYLSDEQGRLKKVADDLPIVTKGIDAQLNSESTNPVQNKVLYDPVSFAEAERILATKNLWDIYPMSYKQFTKNAFRLLGREHVYLKNNNSDGSILEVDVSAAYEQYSYLGFKTKDTPVSFAIQLSGLEKNTEYTITLVNSYQATGVDSFIFCDKQFATYGDTTTHVSTFTTDAQGKYVFENGIVINSANALVYFIDIMLEKGSVFTEYVEPMGRTAHELDILNLQEENKPDTELNKTSTKAVQNKVLYNPVSFAESERQKTLNLLELTPLLTLGYSLNSADGSMISDSLWYVSDYINVQGLSGVLIEGNRDSGQSNCFYDANKTFISTYNAIKGYVPVPSNAVYMRINGLRSQTGGGYTNIYQGDTVHNNVIQGMNGVVLWENPNKKSPFTPQTITLSNSISNFDYLILEYEAYMPANDVYNCRQYSYFRPIVDGSLEVLSGGWDDYTRYVKARSFKITSETQIQVYTGWQEDAINDRMVVPLKIFGVKKGV